MSGKKDVKQQVWAQCCQEYGHSFVAGRCTDCGELEAQNEEIVICAGDEGELSASVGGKAENLPATPGPVLTTDAQGRTLVDGHKRYALMANGVLYDYSSTLYGGRVRHCLGVVAAVGIDALEGTLEVIDTTTGEVKIRLTK